MILARHLTVTPKTQSLMLVIGLLCTSIQVARKEPAKLDFHQDEQPIPNWCINVKIRLVPFVASQP